MWLIRCCVCVLLCIFELTGEVFGQAEIEFCLTPRELKGECIVITQCKPLVSILQNRPLKPQDTDFLKKSQCGFDGIFPKVCCPPEELTTTQVPPKPDTNEVVLPPRTNLLPGTDICGTATGDKIYGGEKTDLDEFPWMALIEYQRPSGQKGFYCGGVLISSKYVLTAAHCVKGNDLPKTWRLISVRLGEYDTESASDCINNGFTNVCAPPAIDVPVQNTIAHESYDPNDKNQYHDIALLRLQRSVPFSDFVKPICLPTTTDLLRKPYTGTNLFVAGWGKTENRSESNIKLKLQVPVNSNNVCVRTYSSAGVSLKDGQLCAGGKKGKDSCRGDSGGPLMAIESVNGEINWYSVGVVSFGPSPCGLENWPGVYTKVANYASWIVSKLSP